MAMNQYLLIPLLEGWTSIYQLFLCSPGVQGFDHMTICGDFLILGSSKSFFYLTMDDLGINDISNLRPPHINKWIMVTNPLASGNLTLAIENQQNTDCHNWSLPASGKRLHNYGKSPFLLGKSTISSGPVSIGFCMFTRGEVGYNPNHKWINPT
jgi:hypothetical protein